MCGARVVCGECGCVWREWLLCGVEKYCLQYITIFLIVLYFPCDRYFVSTVMHLSVFCPGLGVKQGWGVDFDRFCLPRGYFFYHNTQVGIFEAY